jgi:phosphoglucosamine mutase
MKRLFGTDGIRGTAGEYPLDASTIHRLGRALGGFIDPPGEDSARVLIGRDTRCSGPGIEASLTAGLRSAGAMADSVGIVTTPGLAYLTRQGPYAAGAMISASHNPYRDNGVKVLGPDGMKLPDKREAALERMVLDEMGSDVPSGPAGPLPPLLAEPDARLADYCGHLFEAAGGEGALAGLSIVLDCSHGSASHIAPDLFTSLGAKVCAIGCEPNGENINAGCGSLHLEPLRRALLDQKADLGLAFDGDADRCLAVDRTGRPLDGDFILFVQAQQLRKNGRLRNDVVVATVMSNLWLEKALTKEGIRMLRAPVGDKYVLDRMLTEEASLGGEQSGHIIFLEHLPSGDGILTGLLMARAVRSDGLDLAALAEQIEPCPQVLLNVAVRSKPELRDHPVIGPTIRRIEDRLAGEGRVLVRYSGTENLARVMVEGTDKDTVRSVAEELAELIGRTIGTDG